MTNYGVDATSLSAPQGAGSNPVPPVETPRPVDTTSGLFAVGEIFAKGLAANRKDEAQKRQNSIIGEYVQAENTISEGVAQGSISSAEAAARSRANFRKFSSGFPEYIGEFKKAGDALRGFTEAGVVVDTIQQEKLARAADKTRAAGRGFIFVDGMSKESEDAAIRASQAGITAEREMGQFYAAQAEKRAQGTYDVATETRAEKEKSFQVVNMVAGANLDAFQQFSKDLSAKIKSGGMTLEDGRTLLARNYANISAAIQAGARTNPELAAPYRSIFDSMFKTSTDMLDPKNAVEDAENQFKLQVAQLSLIAMNDPVAAAGIVTNKLFQNNPAIALSVSNASITTFNKLSQTTIGQKNPDGTNVYVPQAVGNPDVEPEVLKLLKQGLSDLKGGKIKDADIAKVQAENSINQILKQTGKLIDQGVDPKQLKGVAEFFASSEYAGFVTSNKIDKQAAGTAAKAFQVLYEPAIINGVQVKLNATLPQGPGEDRTKSVKFNEVVDVKFTGSGISFEPKLKRGVSVYSNRQIGPVVNELRTSQKAINQLIHIAAHMEGSTDYGKFWEENKHIWIPSMFVAPETKKETKPSNVSTEKNMAAAVAGLPKLSDILKLHNTPESISEIKKEIARTTSPSAKSILEGYLRAVEGK